MEDSNSGPVGWPFLVARGRRYGYRTLLLPNILRDLGISGVLEDNVETAVQSTNGGPVPIIGTPTGKVAFGQSTS